MALVRSYVAGHWFAPDSGTPVFDAVTGEPVAEVSSQGIDFGAALAYGRQVGGPALRDLTFHERAELAKGIGQLLRKHRDELYELSYRTGATLYDSKFDIDGGIGVLLSYASKAKRELPNDKVIVEGPPEQLGKEGDFLGQHLLTPRLGVAVQVNAFNFPVWGPLEKLAPALIAGVPSLIKPASQTGYLTALMVELIIDAQILPDGALQLVSGSAGDLLDHLDRAGPAQLHRLGEHRQPAAEPPERCRPVGTVQRRGRLAEHVGPRPRRAPRHESVRPLRQAAGHRDDRQGRAEVHRDPPRLRPGRPGPRGRRGGRRRAGQGRRRQPGRQGHARWARSPASTSARKSAVRSRRSKTPPPSSSGGPTGSRWPAPTTSAARSCPRSCCRRKTTPAAPSCTRSRRSARSAP